MRAHARRSLRHARGQAVEENRTLRETIALLKRTALRESGEDAYALEALRGELLERRTAELSMARAAMKKAFCARDAALRTAEEQREASAARARALEARVERLTEQISQRTVLFSARTRDYESATADLRGEVAALGGLSDSRGRELSSLTERLAAAEEARDAP